MKNTAKFQTSDGYKFYTENDAKNHAKTLEDRKVVSLGSSEMKVIKGESSKGNKDKGTSQGEGENAQLEDYIQVKKKIELAESLEELEPFLTDERPLIVEARAKRTEELILQNEELEKDKVEGDDKGTSQGEGENAQLEDWRQVKKKIELAESLEELEPFLTDKRPSIVEAMAKRTEELILQNEELEKDKVEGDDKGSEDKKE